MRSTASSTSARRALRLARRRVRRRPALVVAGLALGIAVTTGFTATTPVALAEASGAGSGYVLASFTAAAPTVVASPSVDVDESATAREALAAAEASLAAAQSVEADIAASGLDIGVADASVDTAALEEKVAGLDTIRTNAAPFAASLAGDVLELAAFTDERVAALRGSLDAALAIKAEQEAAEQARLEAEAAAAAAAAAAEAAAETRSAAPSAPVYATGGAVGDNSPAGAQATARAMLGSYGWGDDQFSCLVSLWNKESGWNYQAYNSSSGAFGIPQALPGSKMASAGADWQTSASTQVSWGLGYISGRYGSPCGAWSHSQSVGWY